MLPRQRGSKSLVVKILSRVPGCFASSQHGRIPANCAWTTHGHSGDRGNRDRIYFVYPRKARRSAQSGTSSCRQRSTERYDPRMNDASTRLNRYLLLQFAVNVGYGVLFGLGLYAIGIPHPLLWGVLGCLLRFIPYIGTPVAATFPMAMAFAVFPGWSQVGLTFGLFLLSWKLS